MLYPLPVQRRRMDETDANDEDEDGAASPAAEPLCAGVVTVATDRSLDTDPAGEAIVTLLEEDGLDVVMREHVNADHDKVQSVVSRMIDRDDVDVVITGGATSIEPSDVTLEAVGPLIDKELTAFSELFTTLAYERVGSRAVAARTLAGVAEDVPVFCLPGNGDAVRLAIEEIVLPEAVHLVELAREDLGEDAGEIEKQTGQRGGNR